MSGKNKSNKDSIDSKSLNDGSSESKFPLLVHSPVSQSEKSKNDYHIAILDSEKDAAAPRKTSECISLLGLRLRAIRAGKIFDSEAVNYLALITRGLVRRRIAMVLLCSFALSLVLFHSGLDLPSSFSGTVSQAEMYDEQIYAPLGSSSQPEKMGSRTELQRFMEQELMRNGRHLREEILSSLSPHDLPASQLCQQYSIYPNSSRWDSLRNGVYFIAINLFQNEAIIADYLFQVTFLLQALQTQKVFLSIYENASSDHTKLAVELFHAFLATAHIPHWIVASRDRKPDNAHRIEYLAKVRNAAMEPLYRNLTMSDGDTALEFTAKDVTQVLFINDGLFCAEDLLELLLQSQKQEADMTCGADFDVPTNVGFYDTWVARDINGHGFKKYPFLEWSHDEQTNARFKQWLPAQVQCCWNGAAVLNAKAFTKDGIRFRRSNHTGGECSASECSILCNDFGRHGYDRIVMVPKTLIAYEHTAFAKLLELRNATTETHYITDIDAYDKDSRITSWRPLPETVECRGLEGVNSRDPDQPEVKESHNWGPSIHSH